MLMKRKFHVPGLEEISSDDNSDDEIKFLLESDKQIKDYETISIDDSLSDDDLIFVRHDSHKKHANEVWRNIIECDLLDQRIKSLGLKKFRVNREVESYDLPSYKMRRYKRTKFCEYRNRLKGRLGIPRTEIIEISSSEDEVCIANVVKKEEKDVIVIDTDDSQGSEGFEEISSSDSDDNDERDVKLDTWKKLITHLNTDPIQLEFEGSREALARMIAKELNEPKIDLIDRCLIYLGIEQCQKFVTATKGIEQAGGMPTKDGTRRRTAGGVFLTLIKSDRMIDQAVKQQIFQDTDEVNADNESLWWKSVEMNQYRPMNNRRRFSSNYARKKEFKSYTLIDLDYFECFKDFRYRYIPMVSSFPLDQTETDTSGDDNDADSMDDDGDDDDDDGDVMIIDTAGMIRDEFSCGGPAFAVPGEHIQLEVFEMGNN